MQDPGGPGFRFAQSGLRPYSEYRYFFYPCGRIAAMSPGGLHVPRVFRQDRGNRIAAIGTPQFD
jgi:hypothetical protein